MDESRAELSYRCFRLCYSIQAAAIASALKERENAQVYRSELLNWLDNIASPSGDVIGDMNVGREFAEFLTSLVRIGAELSPVDP